MKIKSFIALLFMLSVQVSWAKSKSIICQELSSPQMHYACMELQRYIYQLTDEVLNIDSMPNKNAKPAFVVGTSRGNSIFKELMDLGILVKDGKKELSEEGYLLQTIKNGSDNFVAIMADRPIGCLYGVYGLLDDHYDIGFYMSGDVMPQAKKNFYLPKVNEVKIPSVYIRGFLPWTNFPQSATVYSWEDWKFIIDQATKMRMNFIHVHNYNGQNEHNEMFHNFTIGNYTSRTWMPSARTGHRWNCKGFDVDNFLFKGKDLYLDYDFSASCTLHNEGLSNEVVSAKGISLFQKVISYAHERGIKIALGIDIDLVMPEYGLAADDPKVIDARINQIKGDYPNLDYLVLFVSETINNDADKMNTWKNIFNKMYSKLKAEAPAIRIAVAGWGFSKSLAVSLPEDVIAAPISGYSPRFESGEIYGEREYWGCPWLECDGNSSCYYYPYNMDLSSTMDAFKKRSSNMKGLYCLTWRITDAIDPKLSYIAKAPWDSEDKYKTSYDVYAEYARKNYGTKSAKEITDIINENEPPCSTKSECEKTPDFTGKEWVVGKYLAARLGNETAHDKAVRQSKEISKCIENETDPGAIKRMEYLRCRIDAVHDYLEIDKNFPHVESADALNEHFPSWVKNFIYRVNDISSLGNVQSIENRFIQERYLQKEKELQRKAEVKFPTRVEAVGTKNGAVVSWINKDDADCVFNIYRNGQLINDVPVNTLQYEDVFNGKACYQVEAVAPSGKHSQLSAKAVCYSGTSDNEPPFVVVVSPLSSHRDGQSLHVTARIIDNRAYEEISSSLFYREVGEKTWKKKEMDRRVKSIFYADLPASSTSGILEYYIEVSDGKNKSYFPATAPALSHTVVYETNRKSSILPSLQLNLTDKKMSWKSLDKAFTYHIYRAKRMEDLSKAASWLTYVPTNCTFFEDFAQDFDGKELCGRYYYKVVAEDCESNKGESSNVIFIEY